ncbi:hypothetical protein NPIL_32341 [Nephila pilipes]|uniref:Uncharacterized protein n=1 Tax=Nephila pilipes TaxID=299642 RepID=A0A8X6Q4P1_NEPPI|nr:hypothetical protein NPIL_32341 [Nephila pilipes]
MPENQDEPNNGQRLIKNILNLHTMKLFKKLQKVPTKHSQPKLTALPGNHSHSPPTPMCSNPAVTSRTPNGELIVQWSLIQKTPSCVHRLHFASNPKDSALLQAW